MYLRRRQRSPKGSGGNGFEARLRAMELDIRELKTEQRHTVRKEDLHEAVTRLSQASSDLRASVDTLAERTDAIKEHYATKSFILTSVTSVGSVMVALIVAAVVAALKLL